MSELDAYHEAGHAFLAIHLGARVRYVTIQPDRDEGPARSGATQIEWPRRRLTERQLRENAVLVALAGPVAESLYDGQPYHPGFVAEWAADWQLAWDAAAELVPQERRRLAHLEQVTAHLYRWLNRDSPWAAIAALADHLLAHETLEEEEVRDIIRPWLG